MGVRTDHHYPVFVGIINRRMPASISTDKVALRAQGPWWAPQVHRAMVSSAAQLADRFPWATPLPTEEACRRRGELLQAQFESGTAFAYVIVEKASNQVVGTIDLQPGPQRHIGYWIRHDRWGKGLATAAGGALIHQAFQTLDDTSQLWLRCDAANLASARVAQRLGFRLAACRSTDIQCKGWTDRQMIWCLPKGIWHGGSTVVVSAIEDVSSLLGLGHGAVWVRLQAAQQRGDGQLLVATDRGQTVGAVWVGRSTHHRGGGICQVSDLIVAHQPQHFAVACALMLAAESWAQAAGAPAVWVRQPHDGYGMARRLFNNLGYVDNQIGLGAGPWTDAAGRAGGGSTYRLVKRLSSAMSVHPAGQA